MASLDLDEFLMTYHRRTDCIDSKTINNLLASACLFRYFLEDQACEALRLWNCDDVAGIGRGQENMHSSQVLVQMGSFLDVSTCPSVITTRASVSLL